MSPSSPLGTNCWSLATSVMSTATHGHCSNKCTAATLNCNLPLHFLASPLPSGGSDQRRVISRDFGYLLANWTSCLRYDRGQSAVNVHKHTLTYRVGTFQCQVPPIASSGSTACKNLGNAMFMREYTKEKMRTLRLLLLLLLLPAAHQGKKTLLNFVVMHETVSTPRGVQWLCKLVKRWH